MNRVLRVLVTWLLLVAVPLQGYAAGSMLFCGAGAGTSSAAVEHHHDEDARHDENVAHHHGAFSDTTVEEDASNLHDVMHGKCSVCSSCCSAAALPSAPIAATTAPPHAALFPDLEHADPGHGIARLERPPRLNLA